MNPNSIKFLLFLSVFIFSFPSFSQIASFSEEEEFFKHLRNEGLHKESLFLLSNMQSSSDSTRVSLEKAFLFQEMKSLDSAKFYYQRNSLQSISSQKFYKDYLRLKFRMQEYDAVDSFLNEFPEQTYDLKEMTYSMEMVKGKYQPDELGSLDIPLDIRFSYERFYKDQKKSSALAGLYSALIPGMGKVYIGKKRQGFNMFLSNTVLAIQAYESYRKRGIESARFIVFGSAFSFFYISNIVGSIIGTKKLKRDAQLQLTHDLSQYYLSDYSQHPYYP